MWVCVCVLVCVHAFADLQRLISDNEKVVEDLHQRMRATAGFATGNDEVCYVVPLRMLVCISFVKRRHLLPIIELTRPAH